MNNYIWFEKYRPRSIDNMVLPQDTACIIRKYLNDLSIPHLLFYGRAGSGKTTIAKMLMDTIPCARLELNASGKDRSIETMRTTVVDFASSMPPRGKHIKIVFFDEADGITAEAQNSLKNTMEKYSTTCRFILTANNVNKIIEPIRSRCVEIPLLEFGQENAVQFCESVLQQEGVQFNHSDVVELVGRCYPDMRTTMNSLQKASTSGVLNISSLVATNVVPEVVLGYIKEGKVKSLRTYCAGVTDFMFLYKWLFDNLESYANGEPAGMIAVAICNHLHYEPTIPDREINFATCCVEIMDAIGAKIDFTK